MFWNNRSPRLWDTFIFSDELDILECRLTEYENSDVYKHVIVEATTDHQGHRKPMAFEENMDRFLPWLDKIIYIPVELKSDNDWGRIHEQRDAIAKGLKHSKSDDIILFSDVDEILDPEGIEKAREYVPMMRKGILFNQRHAVFCVDWEEKLGWSGPVALLQKQLPKNISEIRGMTPSYIIESGWHLSWLGGLEAIKLKTTQYCHPELTNYIWNNMEKLVNEGYYWGNQPPDTFDTKLEPLEADEDWPRWVRERKCPDSWFRRYYQDWYSKFYEERV